MAAGERDSDIQRRGAERPSYGEPYTNPAVGPRAGVGPIGKDGGDRRTGSTEEDRRESRGQMHTFTRKYARDRVRGMHTVIRRTTVQACSRRNCAGWPTMEVGPSLRRGKCERKGRSARKLTGTGSGDRRGNRVTSPGGTWLNP